jgi:Carboxypeptidase regulatory-like domain
MSSEYCDVKLAGDARSRYFASIMLLLCSGTSLWGAATGRLSGTIEDQSGAVLPGATIILVNTAVGSEFKAVSDGQGFYSFPALPVGRYAPG